MSKPYEGNCITYALSVLQEIPETQAPYQISVSRIFQLFDEVYYEEAARGLVIAQKVKCEEQADVKHMAVKVRGAWYHRNGIDSLPEITTLQILQLRVLAMSPYRELKFLR